MLSVVFRLTRFHTITYGRKVQHSSDTLERISFDFRECCAKLWDMTLTSCSSKAKTCLSLMPLADPMTYHTPSQSEEEIETIRLVIRDQSVTTHLKNCRLMQLPRSMSFSQSYTSSLKTGPSLKRLPTEVLPFWSIKDQLSFNDSSVTLREELN